MDTVIPFSQKIWTRYCRFPTGNMGTAMSFLAW
jgi:hypothetical protein